MVPLEIQSISTSFSTRNGYNVVLKEIGGVRKFQIIVGGAEAQAMAISSEKIITTRPLTHHFVQMILNDFEIMLKHIVIYKYEDGVYYAHAVLEDNFGHIKYIDCRPSDAICLALKMEKPILAVEEVFEDIQQSYADKVEHPHKSSNNQDLAQIETSRLKSMLKEAIGREDYEMAAKIQEELNRR
ncbi:MAG: bifunctional nuclease family protein [Chitinophagales bacterium]|nr:bifunctional nuclease family protein [Chitinophagales bacterium]